MTTPKDRWELALHPVRIRILRVVAGGRVTTNDLLAQLPDIPQATLYRHLSTLVGAGHLEVVEQHRVRGAVERVYALPDQGSLIDAAALAKASAADHERYFTVFVSNLLAEFSRYLERDRIDYAADGVGYQETVLQLSDAELADFAAGLQELITPLLAHQPAEGRVPRLLATIVLPTGQPAGNDSPGNTTEGN